MIVNEIAKRFNAAANDYDKLASVQQNTAEKLIQCLKTIHPDFIPQQILDVGTGTGYVIQYLEKHFPDACYTANDIAQDMLNVCQKKLYPLNIKLMPGNIETLPITKHDLIVSNFALQWAVDLKSTLHKLYHHCNHLAFTTLVQGSLQEWYQHLQLGELNHYPSFDSLSDIVYELDPYAYIQPIDVTMRFASPKAFMQYLHQLGGSASCLKAPVSILKKTLQNNLPIDVSYRILLGILSRTSCTSL